jgi:hypothetical protein
MAASLDSFGGSRFPLTIQDSATIYDPGLASIVGLLSAAIEANCGDAWRSIVSRLGINSMLAESTGPVSSVLSGIKPNPANLAQLATALPVLAVYREGDPSYDNKSFDYTLRRQQWSVEWVIGPLGPDLQRKVGHFWVPVSNAIVVAIHEGMHPAYQAGAYQFHGQFSEINVLTSGGPAVAEDLTTDKGAGYFGGSVILETVERFTFQNDVAATGFEGGAYLTPHDGYGDDATDALVDVTQPADLENA